MNIIEQEAIGLAKKLNLDSNQSAGLLFVLKKSIEKVVKKSQRGALGKMLYDNKPLHDIDCECALLGCLIKFTSKSMPLVTHFGENVFFDERNTQIWRAIKYLSLHRMVIDNVTVSSYLNHSGFSDEIPISYIKALSSGIQVETDVEEYVKRVGGMATIRQVLEECELALTNGIDFGWEAAESFKSSLKIIRQYRVIRDGQELSNI